MSYFLFGNYCCLDSLYSPPFIRRKGLPDRGVSHGSWEIPGMSLPTASVPEVAVLSVLTQDTCCVRVTSRAVQHGGLPHPASEGTYPHSSRGMWWFRIERACVEFSNIRPCWGWHCGYRRLVFKLQLLLVLKISRPSSVICVWLSEFLWNFNSIFF